MTNLRCVIRSIYTQSWMQWRVSGWVICISLLPPRAATNTELRIEPEFYLRTHIPAKTHRSCTERLASSPLLSSPLVSYMMCGALWEETLQRQQNHNRSNTRAEHQKGIDQPNNPNNYNDTIPSKMFNQSAFVRWHTHICSFHCGEKKKIKKSTSIQKRYWHCRFSQWYHV